jgi:hypothetical protein
LIRALEPGREHATGEYGKATTSRVQKRLRGDPASTGSCAGDEDCGATHIVLVVVFLVVALLGAALI